MAMKALLKSLFSDSMAFNSAWATCSSSRVKEDWISSSTEGSSSSAESSSKAPRSSPSFSKFFQISMERCRPDLFCRTFWADSLSSQNPERAISASSGSISFIFWSTSKKPPEQSNPVLNILESFGEIFLHLNLLIY